MSRGKKGEVKGKKSEEVDDLRSQVDQLKGELVAARETILKMHEREEGIKQRYSFHLLIVFSVLSYLHQGF